VPTPTPATYRLEELAESTGVAVRTIRFYIQRGLLAPPEFRGPNTVYGDEHRTRLEAIRALQEHALPLDAIARTLDAASPAELAAIARGEVRVEPERAVLADAAPAPAAPRAASEARASRSLARSFARSLAVREPGPIELPDHRRSTWTLAPGLELHLDDSAPAATRALARRLLAEASRRKNPRGDSA
jgi:Ca-activated chloride channel family protein